MNDYGLSVRQLAHVAGVTERTARRWKKRGCVPEPYQTALRARLNADTGLASPAWTGWRFYKDELISPEGVSYTVGDVRASRLHQRSVEEYRTEISRRRAEADLNRELQARTTDVLNAIGGLLRAACQLRELLPNHGQIGDRPHMPSNQPNASSRQNGRLLRVSRSRRMALVR
jgi:Phage protein